MRLYRLAAIDLCETYSITKDKQLGVHAQRAIDLILRAQNEDGGWGSQPSKASTTLDIGWPVMALICGRSAGLKVPGEAVKGATRFLDQVQGEGGAYYGLTKPEERADTTSIGLLCRLLLGAKHGEPGIKEGLKNLVQTGPSDADLDFTYFSMLALCGSDANEFASWNRKFHEQSLKAQVKTGDDRGSWPPIGNRYGRLEATAMNLICLQVYYRRLPLHYELFGRTGGEP